MLPLSTTQPVMLVESGASICRPAPASIPDSKLPLTTKPGGGGGVVTGSIETLSNAGPPSPSVRLVKESVREELDALKSRVFKVQPMLARSKPVASNEYS